MGLLDNHPELINEFTMLAQRFAQTGYIAPMNVLWTYHFINNNNEVIFIIHENYFPMVLIIFPRYWLFSHNKFTMLAQRFAQTGYIAPMNVLWTYHFINNNNEVFLNFYYVWEFFIFVYIIREGGVLRHRNPTNT